MMLELKELVVLLLPYWPLMLFFGVLFIGEEMLILFAILSASGQPPIIPLVVVGFLGLLFADIGWFWIARTRLFNVFMKSARTSFLFDIVDKNFSRARKSLQFLFLPLTKFIYGVRIVAIFHFSKRRISFRKFLLHDAYALFIWMIIMIPLAWLAGRGFTKILYFAKGVEQWLLIGVVAIIGFILLEHIAKRLFIRKGRAS